MATIEALVKLLIKKNKTEYVETEVFAKIHPVGRNEHTDAGQKDYKADFMLEVWAFEYSGQTEVSVNGERHIIYRTYGPKPSGKIELYVTERVGKG